MLFVNLLTLHALTIKEKKIHLVDLLAFLGSLREPQIINRQFTILVRLMIISWLDCS
jgi:hypothetical protein